MKKAVLTLALLFLALAAYFLTSLRQTVMQN